MFTWLGTYVKALLMRGTQRLHKLRTTAVKGDLHINFDQELAFPLPSWTDLSLQVGTAALYTYVFGMQKSCDIL